MRGELRSWSSSFITYHHNLTSNSLNRQTGGLIPEKVENYMLTECAAILLPKLLAEEHFDLSISWHLNNASLRVKEFFSPIVQVKYLNTNFVGDVDDSKHWAAMKAVLRDRNVMLDSRKQRFQGRVTGNR